MSQQSEILLWEPKPGLTISLQKGTVLLGQGKAKVVSDLAKMLQRVARLFQIRDWTVEDSVELADWTYENYKFELSDVIVKVLSHPPSNEKENWRLTPDTISKWMKPAIEKQAEEFEREHQKQKLIPPTIAELPDSYLKQMAEIIDKSDGIKPVRPISRQDIEQEGADKPLKPKYHRPTEEEVITNQLHIAYINANYDPESGKRLDTWLSEDEWLRTQL